MCQECCFSLSPQQQQQQQQSRVGRELGVDGCSGLVMLIWQVYTYPQYHSVIHNKGVGFYVANHLNKMPRRKGNGPETVLKYQRPLYPRACL